MKYSQPEKMEIIRMVEDSNLSVRRTLRQLDIPRSSFYEWYRRYQEEGYEGLAPQHRTSRQFWNAIPEWERQRVVEVAREYPEKSCREVAFHITDEEGYFISESSVYRILKAHDLVTSPVYTVISAKDHFENPTTRVNELWQTDFTYFKVIDWGWYYLLTVLDDYSRYIIAWSLCKSMKAEDVTEVLERAISKTGVKHVHVYHRPRLLSDNGPCFISSELKDYLSRHDMTLEGYNVRTTMEAKNITASCNLIVTATPSKSPLLSADLIGRGTHITAMGSDTPEKQELDPRILQKSDIIVADSISQCLLRGEIHQALKAGVLEKERVVELGNVIVNPALQRTSEEQTTIADLTGVAVQDIQIAKAVYHALIRP
jgi:putative transposase